MEGRGGRCALHAGFLTVLFYWWGPRNSCLSRREIEFSDAPATLNSVRPGKRNKANGDKGKALKVKIVTSFSWSKAKLCFSAAWTTQCIHCDIYTHKKKWLFNHVWSHLNIQRYGVVRVISEALEPLEAQRRLGAEMSLCLFKGQENRWPRFLRHGSDLSRWHLYQSRAGFVLCLAARHICLSRSRPWTEAVDLLSNVGPHFMPAVSRHRAIHKQLKKKGDKNNSRGEIYWRKKLIFFERFRCYAARLWGQRRKNEKPGCSLLK